MKAILLLFFITLFASCSSDVDEEILPDVPGTENPEPGEPGDSFGHYKFRLSAKENTGNIFHLFEFHLLNRDKDGLEYNSGELSQVYDSITWVVPSEKGSYNVFSTTSGEGFEGTHLSLQWGHTFYLPGEYETKLLCYKGDEVVHSNVLKVEVTNEKDFLMYNWEEVTISDDSSIGFHNALDEDFTFCAIREAHEEAVGITLFLWPGVNESDEFVEQNLRTLSEYLTSIYGQPDYGRGASDLVEKYEALFLHREAYEVPESIWLTPKSRIVLLTQEHEGMKKVFVRAEPH
ncbi:hypothetical protein AAE250_00680 [Bacteroides sp. GD17]|jgi:hypothetical protein|uniref:hypothetical protein n=1 Tax=Bacteroides sp. GD17 TaxID=3139826 RepID=UPI0025F3154C|nr:hypothetical protein [uncultured Bacteroides sp.]